MMSPAQCRAARGLLNWSQVELAERAGLSESTVRDFEKERRIPTQQNLDVIQSCLESVGVELLTGNQHGVRMRTMRANDHVRFRKGVLMSASYGDAVGVVVRERPEVKMGSVERIDVQFPGHKPLIGVESALFEIFIPSSTDRTAAVCSKCGLQVRVTFTETQIDHLGYISKCRVASERPAFDYGCPHLRKAVSVAHQRLK